MLGLCLGTAIWWTIGIPLFIVFYAPVMAVVSFCKALAEIPSLTINQWRDDLETWSIRSTGAAAVWRSQKRSE